MNKEWYMTIVRFNFVLGIGSVLAAAIFNVLNIDPVINAVISLDQCKNTLSLLILYIILFLSHILIILYTTDIITLFNYHL